MDNNTPPVDQEETIKKIEAIYDETMAKIKTLEDEQKKIISEKEVMALAALPSREELLAKLVGTINAPVSGFVNVLAGNIRGLMTVLKGIADSKA